ANRLGVKALTLYAFSTENWTRPESELAVLWRLLKKFLKRELDELDQENVQLRVIGEVDRLAPDLRRVIDEAIQRLSNKTGLQLTIALSYGSRSELVSAARAFARDCASGNQKPDDLTEQSLQDYL